MNKTTSIKINCDLWKQAKIEAVKKDLQLQSFVELAIRVETLRHTPLSLIPNKMPLLVGIFLVSMLLTGGTVGLYTNAHVSYPDNIFASTNQAQLHELLLKATKENGQSNTIPGFNVDLTNVVSTSVNSELAIFTTDNVLSVVEGKVKIHTDIGAKLGSQYVYTCLSFKGFYSSIAAVQGMVSFKNCY